MKLTKRYRFYASHRLHSHALSEAENEVCYGKCNNEFGHGHNYLLDVTVEGPVDSESGQIVQLANLDRAVQESVLQYYDFRNLTSELPEFKVLVATTENVIVEIKRRLESSWSEHFPDGRPKLSRITIHETPRNIFEVEASHEQ